MTLPVHPNIVHRSDPYIVRLFTVAVICLLALCGMVLWRYW